MKEKYFIYTITRDYGFAPNPFYGFCTLACCKSGIRHKAKTNDWIVGIYSRKKNVKQNLQGKLVFAMKVKERMTFTEYFDDGRFKNKKPYVKGSLKTMHGDNAYVKRKNEGFKQFDCHHHHKIKAVRKKNLEMDTRTDKVLISDHFFYFGDDTSINKFKKTELPKVLRENKSYRNFKQLENKEGLEIVKFLEQNFQKNLIYGDPIDWTYYEKQLKKIK